MPEVREEEPVQDTRRIGGLENPASAGHGLNLDTRRIGGLEIQDGGHIMAVF